jgi:hypothetical protein
MPVAWSTFFTSASVSAVLDDVFEADGLDMFMPAMSSPANAGAATMAPREQQTQQSTASLSVSSLSRWHFHAGGYCRMAQPPRAAAFQQEPGCRDNEHRKNWRRDHAADHRYGDALHDLAVPNKGRRRGAATPHFDFPTAANFLPPSTTSPCLRTDHRAQCSSVRYSFSRHNPLGIVS